MLKYIIEINYELKKIIYMRNWRKMPDNKHTLDLSLKKIYKKHDYKVNNKKKN